DSDGHHIQRNAGKPHSTQYDARRQHVRQNRDERNLEGTEQHQNHEHDGDEDYTDGGNLRVEQTLEHIVVQHQHTGESQLLRLQSDVFNSICTNFFHQFSTASIRCGFLNP